MTAMWVIMFFVELFIPLAMIGFGRIFMRGGPKDINKTFGYRTKLSMKNKDTWEFAHRYCGKLWTITGLVMLPVSEIPLIFVLKRDTDAVALVGLLVMFAQLVPMLVPILLTEAALKRTFDEKDERK